MFPSKPQSCPLPSSRVYPASTDIQSTTESRTVAFGGANATGLLTGGVFWGESRRVLCGAHSRHGNTAISPRSVALSRRWRPLSISVHTIVLIGPNGLQLLKLLTNTDSTDSTDRPGNTVDPIQVFRLSIANMDPARRMAMAPGSGTETGSTKFQARA